MRILVYSKSYVVPGMECWAKNTFAQVVDLAKTQGHDVIEWAFGEEQPYDALVVVDSWFKGHRSYLLAQAAIDQHKPTLRIDPCCKGKDFYHAVFLDLSSIKTLFLC